MLSGEASELGLEYARELAEEALRRRADALFEPLPPPLTVREIAERDGIPVSTVRGRIRQARRELWGDLSDSGIYYRMRRTVSTPRVCDWCGKRLPLAATARKRYCKGSRCRVADFRARRRASSHG
jgi:hypothetical protein